MMAERGSDRVTASLRGPALLVGLRAAFWIVAQLGMAGLLLVGTQTTFARSLEEAVGWWMVYGTVVDAATLAVLAVMLNGERVRLRGLLGPHSGWARTVLLGILVLIATVPAVGVTSLISSVWYADVPPPMFAAVDLPLWATVHSVLVWPVIAEATEALVFLGYALGRLEGRLRSGWLAAAVVVLAWSLSAAAYPMVLADGRPDLGFAAYRAVSLLPVFAAWTALYLLLRRRLVPVIMAMWALNAGTALAIALDLMGG